MRLSFVEKNDFCQGWLEECEEEVEEEEEDEKEKEKKKEKEKEKEKESNIGNKKV